MESDYAGYGVLGAIVILFAIVWALLWLFVPFMIYYLQQDMKRVKFLNESMLAELKRIRQESSADTVDLGKFETPR